MRRRPPSGSRPTPWPRSRCWSRCGARGRAPTFRVEAHHYALVLIEGLEPDRVYEYEVLLDGEPVWPQPAAAAPDGPFPPSTIRTLHGDHPLRIAFKSCRVAAPHRPPWSLPPTADRKRGKGADALYTYALRMRDADPGTWPDLLLLLGDQIWPTTPPRRCRPSSARAAT